MMDVGQRAVPGGEMARPAKTADRPDSGYSLWDYVRAGVFFNLYGLVKYIPSPLGDVLRFLVLKPFVKSIRSRRIKEGVTIWFPYAVSIGRKVSLNEWVFISGFGGVDIGDFCRIAHGCSLISEDHGVDDIALPICEQPKVPGKIVLGRDVWLGAGVRVLRGVKIGDGCVIGAGSVVTRDIPPYSIAVGVPARVVRKRGEASPSSAG
jgi:acetyltransferase-like isoleucine patch superfamily enzyme